MQRIMNPRRITYLSLLAALVCDVPRLWAAPPLLPNMVIFISDDHTLRDSAVYGAKDIQTPHLDKLAAVLDQAVVFPAGNPEQFEFLIRRFGIGQRFGKNVLRVTLRS